MDLLILAKRAREEGVPQTTTPESSAFDDRIRRSSQSPISMTSPPWSMAGPSSGQIASSSSRRLDNIEEDPPDGERQYMKREYEPAELRENLKQWWDDAAREY